MCSSLEELYEHVERDQLTEDLGGNIVFDHREWIQQRAVSSFSLSAHLLPHPSLLFVLSIRKHTIPRSLILKSI